MCGSRMRREQAPTLRVRWMIAEMCQKGHPQGVSLQGAYSDEDIDNTDDEADEEAQIDDGVQLGFHH